MTNEEVIKEFREKFIYDYFDNTGLEILGNREENRPANDKEIEEFILQALQKKDDEWQGKMEELKEKAWKYDQLCK